MSKAATVNSISTPGSTSRRSARTSRPLEEGTGASSSSSGGVEGNKEGNVGMSVTAPPKADPLPSNATPWRHPDELPFVRRDDWTQELMIDYLARKTFTVPLSVPRSKDPFFTITPRNGQAVMIPRRYRIPVLFLAKFQWESIRIVLTASDPVTDWNNCKYEIIHISRICQHFFDAARGAAEMKGSGALSRTWRCPLIDRVLVRFWNHWFLSEESWLKAFYKEFGEEDYEQDILEKDWQRWALKGHKGFQLTKEEITNGITADQFLDGLMKTYGGWTWVVTTPPEPETFAQGPEDNDTPAQARNVSYEAPSSNSTAVPTAPETPDLTRSQEKPISQTASASSDIIPPTQLPSSLAPPPPLQVISSPTLGLHPPQSTLTTEALKTTLSIVSTIPSTIREEVSDINVGTKRIRDDTDVDMDKQTKKAKRKSNSPEPLPLYPATSVVTQGSTLPTELTAPAVHQSQSSCKSSSSIDANDGEAPAREDVHSATVSSTVGEQELACTPTAPVMLPNARERASSVESTDSFLSDLSSLRRSASNTPPPQSQPMTVSAHSTPPTGEPTMAASPMPISKIAAPAAPENIDSVSLHTPLPMVVIPPFLPEDLGSAPIDRDMSVSPIVRSAASSVVRPAITGADSSNLPDPHVAANGTTGTIGDGSRGSTASLTNPSLSAENFSVPAGAPPLMYQAQDHSVQPYGPYAPRSSTVPPSFIPGQTITTDGMLTPFHPLPTSLRTPAQTTGSPVTAFPQFPKPSGVPEQEHFPHQSILHPALQKSPLFPPSKDAHSAPLVGADMNLMNLTDPATSRSSFSTMTAFAQAGLPDPHEKTQKLHASLLVRDLLDFMQTPSWTRHQALVQGERGPVVDGRTRHMVLDGDHAMSVDQRFVILKNSVLAIVNRFDGMKAEQLEKEIADVDSKLKHIFDETWTALNLPRREEWPFKQTTVDAEVQTTAVDVAAPPTTSARDAGVQASVEPMRQLLESVSIQTDCASPDTIAPLSRPSVTPDATMVDLAEPEKDDKTLGHDDISVKAAMASIIDMVHDFVETSKSNKGKECDDCTESSVLAAVMAEFKEMKNDLKKAQETNREELRFLNELHRNEVKALKEELDHREEQRKVELDDLKSQHRAEVETLHGTIRTMEEKERLVNSEDDATRVQPQELLDLRRRISLLESLPRSPGFAPDHVMGSPPLSAGSTARSEFHTVAPKMQAHPLSHLITIDGDDTPTMPFSPRAHMASIREVSASKPGTPLSSERASVSRRDSMDILDEPNIPMPVKTQRKPYMFAPRPSAG